MVSSKATPTPPQGLASTATQRSRKDLKKAVQENGQNRNTRTADLEAKQQVFLAYNEGFTGDNAEVKSYRRVSSIVEKHFERQKHITGGLQFEQVVRLTQSILLDGWMEPGSKQRQELKESADSERENNGDATSINNAHAASLPAVQSTFPQVEHDLGLYKQLHSVPVHLPPKIQHKLLTGLQEKLERCCFRYLKNNFPKILEERGWEDEVDGELNFYARLVYTRNVSSAAICNHESLKKLFARLSCIRHAAVHRYKNLPVQVLAAMLEDGLALAKDFRDRKLVAELQPWHDSVRYLSQDAMEHVQEHETNAKIFEDKMRQLHLRLSTIKEKPRLSERSAATKYNDILRDFENFEAALQHDISDFAKSRYAIAKDDLLNLAQLLGYAYNPIQGAPFGQTYSDTTTKNLKHDLRDLEVMLDDQLAELTQMRLRSAKFKSFDKKATHENASKSRSDSSSEGHQVRNSIGDSDTMHSQVTEHSPEIQAKDVSEPPKRVHDAAFGESEDEHGEKMRPTRKRQSTDDEFTKISKDEFDTAVTEVQHSKPVLESTEVVGENTETEKILTQERTEVTTETQEGIIGTTSNKVEGGLTVKQTSTPETVTAVKEEASAVITATNKSVIVEEEIVSTQKETTTGEVGALENLDTVREQSVGEEMSETEVS